MSDCGRVPRTEATIHLSLAWQERLRLTSRNAFPPEYHAAEKHHLLMFDTFPMLQKYVRCKDFSTRANHASYRTMISRWNIASRSVLLIFFLDLLLLYKFFLLFPLHFLLSILPCTLFFLRSFLFCLGPLGSLLLLLDGLHPLPNRNTPLLTIALFVFASRCIVITFHLWFGNRFIRFDYGDSPGKFASWLYIDQPMQAKELEICIPILL